MPFAQMVIGPPGSGKTTYCRGMGDFLRACGRSVAVVNLDPGNDVLPFAPDLDVCELIRVGDVMERLGLGPNGALVYCMDYIHRNIDWLLTRLDALTGPADRRYVLFDMPGQVELYTHGTAVHDIAHVLVRRDWRLAAVHLVDAHYCTDAGKFVAVALTTLATMVRLELPQVNVLSKIDLIEAHGSLGTRHAPARPRALHRRCRRAGPGRRQHFPSSSTPTPWISLGSSRRSATTRASSATAG